MNAFKLLMAGGVVALAGQVASATFVEVIPDDPNVGSLWTGKRSLMLSDDGIADGIEQDLAAPGTNPLTNIILEWKITQSDITNLYTYEYTITKDPLNAKGSVSHFTIEVSPTFTGANALEGSDSPHTVSTVTTRNNAPGNIDGIVNALKWDIQDGPTEEKDGKTSYGDGNADGVITYTLITDRAPVWGDFYIKDGNHWSYKNLGFATEPTGNGGTGLDSNYFGWIATPDSTPGESGGGNHLPTPIAAGMGLIGFGIIGLRRQRPVRA